MRFKILGSIFFLIFMHAVLYAQNGNPFDINKRIQDSTEVLPDTTLNFQVPTEETQQKSYLQIQQEKLMGENPFNVSHFPLRSPRTAQNQIDEEEGSQVEVAPQNEQITRNLSVETITKQGGNKFIFWILFVQLLLLTSLIGVNRGFIGKLWRSINNDNFAKLIARDHNNGYSSSFVLLYPIFILSLSLFIYLCLKHFGSYSGIRVFGFFFLATTIIYIIRHIYHGIIVSIYPFRKNIIYYNFTIILFNSVLGLLLIPINLSISYGPGWLSIFGLYFGFFVIGIAILLRYLRAVLDSYTILRNHVIHFFIYLCTCEIAPVFFLVKFLSKSFVQ